MRPRTALIICAKAPRRLTPTVAVRYGFAGFVCSYCGARVKVVA